MTPEKKERNQEIVRLRDERQYSFQKLADMFGMKAKSTVHKIYTRTKEREKASS